MRKLLLLFILGIFGTYVQGQTSLNITLSGHLNTSGIVGLNDCWGYTDSQGNEYAFVGIQSGGLGIIDVTNPASPNLLQTIPGVSSVWRDIKTWGEYAYIVNDDGGQGGAGLLIVDLSTLPGTVAYKDTSIQGMTVAHNLYIDDGYAYITGGDNNAGIDILDVDTDPWHPSRVGQYTGNYVHDVYVRNDTAYSCELGSGLTLIDVSNKANPVVVGNRQYLNNFTHNSWTSDDGTICYTTDEIGAGFIYAWDVRDPQNIIELDNYRSSLSAGQAIPHNVHVLNDYLVISYYHDGITIVDAQYPYNLIETGYYDTSPLTGSGFDGLWGAYPFFPSGTVIGSDLSDGLFVFNVAYTRACYLEGDVTDAVTGQPIFNASVTVTGQTWNANSNGLGFYATGTATPGTYTVTYSAFGYLDSTITVTMANGTLLDRDIPLQPVNTYSMTLNVIEAGSSAPIAGAEVIMTPSAGSPLNYTADANGQVSVASFVPSTYSVLAGKWGWRTKEVTYNASSGNASLTIELELGYYDDFALDFAWTTSSNASTGDWEIGEPVGTSYQGGESNPELDLANDLSDRCYVTDNGGGNAGDHDIDGGEVVLTSPVMDLSAYQEPVIRYYRWFFNEGGQSNPNDSLVIELDNGITTVRLNYLNNTWNNWVLDTFIVSQFIAPTANMTISFRAGDYSPGHLVEAAVDGFEVIDIETTSRPEMTEFKTNLDIFPNPLGQRATVSYELPGTKVVDASFVVTDVMGRVQYEKPLNTIKGEFFLELDLAQGMYFAAIRNRGQVLRTIRIVK